MSWVSLMSFLVCIGMILFCFRKDVDFLSPGRIFSFVWVFAIGLADLKFSRLQYEWTFFGWMLLCLGVGSFLMGVFMVHVLQLSIPKLSLKTIRMKIQTTQINSDRLFKLTIIIFVVYIGAYIANTMISGFIPFFSARPAEMRTKFGVFGFGLINHSAACIMFFVVQYYLLVAHEQKRKVILAIIFLFSAVTYFFLLQRFDFAIWAVVSIAFLYYSSNYLRLRTLFMMLVIFIGLYFGVTSIRLTGHVANFLYYMSEMKFPIQYAIFTEPYMYLVTNLENFVHASERLDHHTYGYYTFDFLLALTGLKHWLSNYFVLNDTPYLTSGYNTYSFFWRYYRDFGVAGLMFFPMIEGAAVTLLYNAMRRNPNVLTISMYSLTVFVIVISFFHNALSMLQFVYIVAVIFVVNSSIVQKNRSPVNP